MNKRLKYEKYRGFDNIITIDLHNGYSIIAIIGESSEFVYDVQLLLKENTVDRWSPVDNIGLLTFNASKKTIHSAILKTVDTYLHDKSFDKCIQEYEYELKCFDLGNDIYEKERLGEK